MFVDSHAHITCDPVFDGLEDVLARARAVGVEIIINVCTDKTTLDRGLALPQTYGAVYHIGATTPHDVKSNGERHFPLFERAASEKRLVAIGETGLDYYYLHSPKKAQQEYLIRYCSLAQKYSLPLVVHCRGRDAFKDLFALLEESLSDGGVALHCFTGGLDEAKMGVDRGWLISFSGIITFTKSHELRRIAKCLPLENILIETDTPYLAPQSKRGRVNEPSFIREVAQTIADIKKISIEDVATATKLNAVRFFRLEGDVVSRCEQGRP